MYLAKKTDRLACPTAIKINKVHCNVHCVSKKNIPDVFSYNSRKH